MIAFVSRRVALAVPTVALVSVLVFLLQALLPGDAALVTAGEVRDPEVLARIRAALGLDDPLAVRYAAWAARALAGDFGVSLRTGFPVSELIASRLPATVQLMAMALFIALSFGIPAGVIAAVRHGRAADRLVRTAAVAALSVPHVLLGMLFVLLFAVHLGWMPAAGWVPFAEDPAASLRAMALPALVLGAGGAATVARHVRAAMLEVMTADFIRTARAKGLSERSVVVGHALRHALVPAITVATLLAAELLGGAAITEQIFSIPGLGKLLVDAVFARDFPVVQGIVLWTGIAFVAMNLCADVLQAALDPRIRVTS